MMNTFKKYSERIPEFMKTILDTNPEFIVPVERKGCKLLRYLKKDHPELVEKIRYKQFFINTKMNLKGKSIAIIDDASKYTSTLREYRELFEKMGAVVSTYSFVGQISLKNAKREQYDKNAHIFQYLDESTYQEYIIQQSIELSKEDYSFDIDHFVFRCHLSKEVFNKFIKYVSRLGRIEFSNDVYTPEHITKLCLFDFSFAVPIPFDSSTGLYKSPLLKIRFVYNEKTESLAIDPLYYVTWDSNQNRSISEILSQLPLILPYSDDSELGTEATYMNIQFICCICLLKAFLHYVGEFINADNLSLDEYDLNAYIGLERSEQVVNSLKKFISETMELENYTELESSEHLFNISSVPVFSSVMSIMQELRREYERRISNAGTVLNVRFFLSYEQIFSRYTGRASLMKWIDILCDRGVLVTRNRASNGIYYRACRSGEGDSDHAERKTSVLLPIIINECGVKTGKVHRIRATYLNKILANLAYDYPKDKDSNDFHTFFTKPYFYGPLTYATSQLLDEAEVPFYSIDKLSKYCMYDERSRDFIALNQESIDEIDTYFSQTDMISISEIIEYIDFLKEIREKFNKDDILNELIICRDQDIYYRHVHYDIVMAHNNITRAFMAINNSTSQKLREAAKVANEAVKKLNYNPDKLFSGINESFGSQIRYRKAYKKVYESIVPFSDEFNDTIPSLRRIALLEQAVINLMLYQEEGNGRYLQKSMKIIVQENFGHDLPDFEELELSFVEKKYARFFDDLKEKVSEVVSQLYKQLTARVNQLPKPKESDYVLKNRIRERTTAINKCVNYVNRCKLDHFAVLHFDYSGYRNLNGAEEMNVSEQVKDIVSSMLKDQSAGQLAHGSVGADTFGMAIFPNISGASQFALRLKELFSKPPFEQIEFRFGCCYRYKTQMIEKDIDDAWKKARNCCGLFVSEPLLKVGFAIEHETYQLLNDEEKKDFMQIPINPISTNSDIYYTSNLFASDESEHTIMYKTETDDTVRIGIVTALIEEYIAVQAMLESPKTAIFPSSKFARHETGRTYCVGYIKSLDGKRHTVALTQTLSAGNNAAASRANSLLNRFPNLDVIIMTGIAGGVPYPSDKEKHVRLGDIVVAKEITSYDFVKEKREFVQLLGRTASPSARLVEAQQRLSYEEFMGKRSWEKYINSCINKMPKMFQRPAEETDKLYDYAGNVIPHPDDEQRDGFPRIFKEAIASANRVLKNPQKRDELREKYDVYAVEMEASGIADATWESEIGYYVVRGISDYCDGHKNDIWHNYAALVAAAYTRALIEKMPS